MSDHQETPDVDEIKARLKGEEIQIEDETLRIEAEDLKAPKTDVAEELGTLGRRFAETLRGAWNSEERAHFESELREGVRQFVDEVDKIVRDVRSGSMSNKLQEGGDRVREEVRPEEIGDRARVGITKGLRWLSVELEKLADQFNAKEKTPEDIEVVDIDVENK